MLKSLHTVAPLAFAMLTACPTPPGDCASAPADCPDGGTQAPLQILSFAATPGQANAGESVTISWRVQGALQCELAGHQTESEDISGEELVEGSRSFTAVQRVSVVLTCTDGATGTTEAELVVPVARAVLTSEPSAIARGESSTLTWATEDVTGCAVVPALADFAQAAGSATVTPASSVTYALRCDGYSDQVIESQATVAVLIEEFSSRATEVTFGSTVTFDFAVGAEAARCEMGGEEVVDLSAGEFALGPLTATTDVALECWTAQGDSASSESTQVVVRAQAPVIDVVFDQEANLVLSWSSENATSCAFFDGEVSEDPTAGGTGQKVLPFDVSAERIDASVACVVDDTPASVTPTPVLPGTFGATSNLAPLDGVLAVGVLTLSSFQASALPELAALQSVGSFISVGSQSLTAIELPSLRSVTTWRVTSNTVLARIAAPLLTSVGGDLELSDNGADSLELLQLELDALTEVGSLTVTNHANLECADIATVFCGLSGTPDFIDIQNNAGCTDGPPACP